MVWKLIANCSLNWKDLEDVDLHYARSLKALYSADSAGNEIKITLDQGSISKTISVQLLHVQVPKAQKILTT
jgi:hypothetical protein